MFEKIKDQLQKHNISFQENFDLSTWTTFRIGGSCPVFIQCAEPQELQQIIKIFINNEVIFQVIGYGSNLLISDEGLPFPVIAYSAKNALIKQEGHRLIVSASTQLDQVAEFAASHGLKGMNYSSGIPGTIGGAVVGNAGAFGSQISDHITEIEVLHLNGETSILSQQDLNFSYRHSIFKDNLSTFILSVCLDLEEGDKEILTKERRDLLTLRQEKHPDYKKIPYAGSFFKNVIREDGTREAAGWFLERSDCKDLKVGGAVVYNQHANIILNQENASAEDVIELALEMRSRVKDTFNLILEPEVRLLGVSLD